MSKNKKAITRPPARCKRKISPARDSDRPGILRVFDLEKSDFTNRCKLLSIKAKVLPGCALKNVLTAKMGRFLGVLAAKQGVEAVQKAFYFSLFQVLVVFCVCKLLSVRILRKILASQKNRAEKPTMGFWFLAGSANLAA